MILFLISFVLTLITSYLLTSFFKFKKTSLGISVFSILFFANIILSIEILSLFKLISPTGIIVIGVIWLLVVFFLWNKIGKPLFKPQFKPFFKSFLNVLKRDKSFYFLFFGFLVLIISAFILALIMPINENDAQAYHVFRASMFVSNHCLGHFEIGDIRALIMPINSEILYTWVMAFFKKDAFLGIFTFFAYLFSLVSLWGILSLLGFSSRKKFWALLMLSSFSSLIGQIASVQTDIIVGCLIVSSIHLFLSSLKDGGTKSSLIFISSLSYAIAVGVKTPALFAIPAVGAIYFLLCLYFNKKGTVYERIKPLIVFCGFFVLNFLIFSSYNYVLNFVDFKNPLGPIGATTVHSFHGGFAGFIANFIRYIYMHVDFTGFKWGFYLNDALVNSKEAIFAFLKIPLDTGVSVSDHDLPSGITLEQLMGLGVLGLLVFVPCVFVSLIKIKKGQKSFILGLFGALYLLCIIFMSMGVGFMPYNIRFFTTFVIVSSPILVYSYSKKNNLFKILMILFMMFYLALVSTHLNQRPFFKIIQMYKQNDYETFRKKVYCHQTKKTKDKLQVCSLNDELTFLKDKNSLKIGAFTESSFDNLYLKENIESMGHKCDFLLMEKFNNYDLGSYSFLITPMKSQKSTLVMAPVRLKNNVACIYTDPKSPSKIATKSSFGVNCPILSSGFNQKGFSLYKKIFIKNALPGEESFKEFYIWANQDNKGI